MRLSEMKPLPPEIFPRDSPLDEEHVKRLAEAISAGEELPPIVVDGQGRIVSGMHRAAAWAAVAGPDADVPTEARSFADDRAVFLAAVEANAKHGLPHSEADRRRIEALESRQRNGGNGHQQEERSGLGAAISRSVGRDAGLERDADKLAGLLETELVRSARSSIAKELEGLLDQLERFLGE